MDFQIHLLDLTNGTYRRITRGGGACRPGWSPDGTEIAFVRIEREPSRLETIRDEGPRVLFADTQLWSYYPAYSPDGRYVAFSVSPEHHEGEDWDLALMDLQQPGRFVRLTSGAGNDRVPEPAAQRYSTPSPATDPTSPAPAIRPSDPRSSARPARPAGRRQAASVRRK